MNSNDIYSPPSADLVGAEEDAAIESNENLASRWARLGAVMLDSLVLGLPFVVFMYGTDYWDRAIKQEITVQEQFITFLIGLGAYFVVNGYLLAKRGQTIGKFTLGIKIVSSENSQLLPLWKLIFLRYLPESLIGYIPIVGLLLFTINALFIFRKDKRCIHDFIAGTKVIKEYAP